MPANPKPRTHLAQHIECRNYITPFGIRPCKCDFACVCVYTPEHERTCGYVRIHDSLSLSLSHTHTHTHTHTPVHSHTGSSRMRVKQLRIMRARMVPLNIGISIRVISLCKPIHPPSARTHIQRMGLSTQTQHKQNNWFTCLVLKSKQSIPQHQGSVSHLSQSIPVRVVCHTDPHQGSVCVFSTSG